MIGETIDDDLMRLRLLQALRVAGWLDRDRLAAAVADLDGIDIDAELAALTGAGSVRSVQTPKGQLHGLTPEGTATAERALTGELRQRVLPEAAELVRLLDRFERADPVLKQVVTAFQRERSDAGAAAVADFHAEHAGLLGEIGAAGALWAGYPQRFAGAVAAIESGQHDYVASPMLDSYHTLWHLLHRELRMFAG
ncbi:hypothetical protein [Nocardia cyriacigeorgica]|uniref:hypothetical protein n=1 Tax=Nocardia cyriacigeorgica TaxID=135487 RepID=UPI0018932245|nr:hypothetical protein [Nocardia cyriacigeorgica]MBF6452144.1 hypothetical protein [Nocardia cyriacigeorgica]MBF6478073.1 hypothetical protein [Nocardia cyriacigeorgica]MBF6549313.1 hypothetical protein [Nocardia cyriacigeorgica]